MASSLVMLFNRKEAIVIRATCGKTHRHTTLRKKHENPVTRCKLSGTLGRTTSVTTPVLGLSRSCFGRCFLKCFSVLPYSHFPSTRSWFSLWCSRLFFPWPSCLTLGLALSQLAPESALANSVVLRFLLEVPSLPLLLMVSIC